MIKTILAFILLIGIIVFIHEFGHFITAKKFGVYVHEFSLGMGPKLFSKQGKETKYSLRLLPIGGFVSMAGENVNVEVEADKNIPDERKFCNQKYWKKIIILSAGVVMNILLATLLFSGLLLGGGKYYAPVKTVITGITENSPAESAGFQVGDVVVSVKVDDKEYKVKTFTDMQILLSDKNSDAPSTYIVERNGERLELSAIPEWNEEVERYLIGIQGTSTEERDVNIFNCLYYGFRYCIDLMFTIISSLRMLFMPNGLKQISGPVGIANIAGEAADLGILPFISLLALISLNIGVMNLLPLPVLDGGQIVIETIEKIIRRKIPEKAKVFVMLCCWVLLLGLMVVATINDISNL